MKYTLKGHLTRLFCILFLIVIVVWIFFYIVVSNYIYSQAEKQLAAATNQITEDLNREFSAVEQLCYQLSVGSEVQAFMDAENMEQRFSAANKIDALLHGAYNLNFVSDIVALDSNGGFYRFEGSLSNASCAYLFRRMQGDVLPNHITISAPSRQHLGYAVGVYDTAGVLSGYLLIMTDQEKLNEMMYSYAFDDFLTVGIAAGGELITKNHSTLQERYRAFVQNPDGNSDVVIKQMGLTPYKAIAALDQSYLRSSTIYFSVAAIIMVIAFACALLLFVRAMQKLFLTPMLSIMANAQQIGSTASADQLQRTGQAEFDQLVEQINSMVSRLEENSQALFQMQYKMQQTEFEKQQAILISLKKQINAHFTVNTLNVVKRFNETGENKKAGIICDGLSSLLRYANGADEFVICRDELYLLEQYVDIMRIRYPGRFSVIFDAEDELDDVELPRMLVQPIVENAITHGLLSTENGQLYISAEVERDVLIFKISDNGKGMTTEALKELQEKIHTASVNSWGETGLEHIALPNIQKRVVSMFGECYGLSIVSAFGEGTTVTLTIPVCGEHAQ